MERGKAARDHGEASGVYWRDGEGLACGSSALITAAALVCRWQPLAWDRHKSGCWCSSSSPNPSGAPGAGKAAWPARNGTGTPGSGSGVLGGVGPGEGRTGAPALACGRARQHAGRASPPHHSMCAAAETSIATDTVRSMSVPREDTTRGWCRSPCVTWTHPMLVKIPCRCVQSSAQPMGLAP